MNLKLEILHLRMVKAIVEMGTVTKAAETLGITQSALSHRIKDAERRIGKALFVKRGKKLTLTAAGERLLYAADIVLKEMENVEFEISTLGNTSTELIKIGMKSYGIYDWLTPVLIELNSRTTPDLIELSVEIVDEPLTALKDEKIDLAILSQRVMDTSFQTTKLFKDELFAVLPKNHPNASKPYLEPEDFSGESYILHETTPEKGREYDKFFSHEPLSLKKIIKVGLTDAILELVQNGIGVTILNHRSVKSYLHTHDIVTVPLTKNKLFIEWYAVSRSGSIQVSSQIVANLIKKTGLIEFAGSL